MVRAFVFLANLPVLPFRPEDKLDIVNVDFVADAIVTLHQKEKPQYDIYHLSSGTGSQTFKQLTDALAAARHKSGPMFMPGLERPFSWVVNTLSNRRGKLGFSASLLKVFLPYLVWNTVFDNTRATTELNRKPIPFSQYSYPLLKFSSDNQFSYKYQDWPTSAVGGSAA